MDFLRHFCLYVKLFLWRKKRILNSTTSTRLFLTVAGQMGVGGVEARNRCHDFNNNKKAAHQSHNYLAW